DTNYVVSLLKKAIVCQADSQFNEGIKYCKEALLIAKNNELLPEIYNTYGSLNLNLKHYDEAIRIFDTAIAKYPATSLLYYNKGVAYLESDRFEMAEQWFQKSLMINPYMYSAHYNLGLAALLQGKIVPGYISYFSYLLFSPNGRYSAKAINVLQQISIGGDEILKYKDNRKANPGTNYLEVEDVLFSKIALDKAYKPLTSIDDPISRQIQAVIEKVEFKADDADFWVQYYVPFLKKMYADNKFNLFIHHLFSSVDIPAIATFNEKNKKQSEALINEASNYFNLIRETRQLSVNGRDTVALKYFFDDGSLFGKGSTSKTGKVLFGPWEGLYESGNIKSKGNYNSSGERVGNWIWYTFDGGISSKENYTNGKLNGEQEYYFDNGNISSKEMHVNGMLQGKCTIYYYGGGIKTISNYKSDKLDGESKDYYNNGAIKSAKNYLAGLVNGITSDYYKNGKLESTVSYVNGKGEGQYRGYNEVGILIAEGNFLKDNMEGKWKYYYDSGSLKQTI
ncbi:MAG: tetratricopeptide repeat protein, partial [Pedobacter sp.]